MTEACDLPAIEARRLIGAKKLSPVELLAQLGEVVRPLSRVHGGGCGLLVGCHSVSVLLTAL